MSEIKHHGILGMRWGVRRFQNKDGTLTAAGKKRYSEEGTDNKEPETEDKYKLSEMSDADLQKKINRLNMEQNYKRLVDQQNAEKEKNQETEDKKSDEKLTISDHAKAFVRRKIDEMSNQDLNDEINRRQKEKQLEDLRKRKPVTNGSEKVKKALAIIGVAATAGELALKLKNQGEGLYKWMLQGEGINVENLKGHEIWPGLLNKEHADYAKQLLDIPIDDLMLTKG